MEIIINDQMLHQFNISAVVLTTQMLNLPKIRFSTCNVYFSISGRNRAHFPNWRFNGAFCRCAMAEK